MILRTLWPIFLAAPALADCPVRADMGRGVDVRMEDGIIDTYRAGGAGIVIAESPPDGDGVVVQTELGQGTYVLALTDIVDGKPDIDTQYTFSFGRDPTDLPVPRPNTKSSFKTNVRIDGDRFVETLVVSWGAATTITYGDCRYEMIPGEFIYDSVGYQAVETVHFLPELGIGILYTLYDNTDDTPDLHQVVSLTAVGN